MPVNRSGVKSRRPAPSGAGAVARRRKIAHPKRAAALPTPGSPASLREVKLSELHLGQRVTHPQYGEGVVKAINEYATEVQFNDGRKPIDPVAAELVPAEPTASLQGLGIPLNQLIRDTVDATVARLGITSPDEAVAELGKRWQGGKLVLHSADSSLQPKEVELELFFHKLVMMRNQLRVLEQKVNGSDALSSADKFDWQQYVTRCYGSMTTFNLLFKDKESHF